jgi:hypothetical protein
MRKRSSKKPVETTPPPPEHAEGEPAPPEVPVTGKNPAAVALGRLGGAKGGPARAAKLTKEQRIAIAKKAAQARWGKKKA